MLYTVSILSQYALNIARQNIKVNDFIQKLQKKTQRLSLTRAKHVSW